MFNETFLLVQTVDIHLGILLPSIVSVGVGRGMDSPQWPKDGLYYVLIYTIYGKMAREDRDIGSHPPFTSKRVKGEKG